MTLCDMVKIECDFFWCYRYCQDYIWHRKPYEDLQILSQWTATWTTNFWWVFNTLNFRISDFTSDRKTSSYAFELENISAIYNIYDSSTKLSFCSVVHKLALLTENWVDFLKEMHESIKESRENCWHNSSKVNLR